MLALCLSETSQKLKRYSAGFLHTCFRLREIVSLRVYTKLYQSGIIPLISPSHLERKLKRIAKITLSDGLCAENAAAAFLHFKNTFNAEWNRTDVVITFPCIDGLGEICRYVEVMGGVDQ